MRKKRNRTGSSIDGAVAGTATAMAPSSEGGPGAKNDRKVASRDNPDLESCGESGSSEKETKTTPENAPSLSGTGKAPPIPGAFPDSKAVAAAKPKEESKLGSGNAKSQTPPRDYNPRWKGYVYILLVRASS
jgi:hypothetical protein